MLATGTTTWRALAAESFIGRIANIGIKDLWSVVLGGSYDDAQVCSCASPSVVSVLDVTLFYALSGSYWPCGKCLTTGHHTELTTTLSQLIFDAPLNMSMSTPHKRIVQGSAAAIYDLVAAQWDDTCGGGGKCVLSS
jgi:hypothetical protein